MAPTHHHTKEHQRVALISDPPSIPVPAVPAAAAIITTWGCHASPQKNNWSHRMPRGFSNAFLWTLSKYLKHILILTYILTIISWNESPKCDPARARDSFFLVIHAGRPDTMRTDRFSTTGTPGHSSCLCHRCPETLDAWIRVSLPKVDPFQNLQTTYEVQETMLHLL